MRINAKKNNSWLVYLHILACNVSKNAYLGIPKFTQKNVVLYDMQVLWICTKMKTERTLYCYSKQHVRFCMLM